MDSVSQALLGAVVAAACVPARHRRKALLAGAMLGTVPDLDVFIDYGDAVRNMTFHRGSSHSVFVLAGLAAEAARTEPQATEAKSSGAPATSASK